MDLRRRAVSSAMRTEFASLHPKDRLDLAELMMKLGRLRHLPVLEEGRLVGMVSHRDVLAASLSRALEFETTHRHAFLRAVDAAEIMSRDVQTIAPHESLATAARRMVERQIGCLPVVHENRVMVGMLTETDLVRLAYLD